jgi:hypothetical protein
VAYDEFFGDCAEPKASFSDCERVIEHWRVGGDRPVRISVAGRDVCDPHHVALEIIERDLGERSRTQLVEERYTALARAIYPSLREYWSAIEDALHEARYPHESTRRPRAVPIFEPRADQQLTPGPHHDLARLLRETLKVAKRILDLPAIDATKIEIEWTRRLVKGWYAMAYYYTEEPAGVGRIRVNRLLDTPDLSEEALRYLLWHEYLHLHLKAAHPKGFRELEHRWPTAQEGDRELYTLNERFGIQYW